MHRRSYLKNCIALTTLALLPSEFASADDRNYTLDELMGITLPDLCGDFYQLRNEVYEAFNSMRLSAEKNGIKIWCTSGYRSFNAQKGIWNSKYNSVKKANPALDDLAIIQEITKYSSIPGTSRHHWGTDVDIVDALGYFNEEPLSHENFNPGGEYQHLGHWLSKNAASFGFQQVYTPDTQRTGFFYEPWHYTYAPLSINYYRYMKFALEEIDMSIFQECHGNDTFSQRDFFKKYIDNFLSGINEGLK